MLISISRFFPVVPGLKLGGGFPCRSDLRFALRDPRLSPLRVPVQPQVSTRSGPHEYGLVHGHNILCGNILTARVLAACIHLPSISLSLKKAAPPTPRGDAHGSRCGHREGGKRCLLISIVNLIKIVSRQVEFLCFCNLVSDMKCWHRSRLS